MTTTYVGEAARSSSNPLSSRAARLRSAFARWLEHQRAERELMQMSDRDLHDIGIERGQIRALVRGASAAA